MVRVKVTYECRAPKVRGCYIAITFRAPSRDAAIEIGRKHLERTEPSSAPFRFVKMAPVVGEEVTA